MSKAEPFAKRRLTSLHARDVVLSLGRQTKIMGIVNCTPDSFSGDGKLKGRRGPTDTTACLRRARRLLREGADILDIGGESTRPGAKSVGLEEEIRRVVPVVAALARDPGAVISVDTSKMEVAHRCLDHGACIINNVRAHQMTSSFLKLVRDYKAAIVIMHMRGTPATMPSQARYKNVVLEVVRELQISIEKCLAIGIKKDRIMVDPGIGFAKTHGHNLALINHLDGLKVLGCPILLGTSRKSFIGEILQKHPGGRLMGTAATVVAGVVKGAHIVRVHDVLAIKETLKVTDAILNAP